MPPPLVILVTARDEADRLPATLAALRRAFPAGELLVADDGSHDATPSLAAANGASVVRNPGRRGKGEAATLAASRVSARARGPEAPIVLLCDGDLGESAARLGPLVDAIAHGRCDVAVAAFRRRQGGGFGLARGFARWAIARRCGARLVAPISGQRALRAEVLPAVLPFAAGFGMEIGMTIDALRAGFELRELPLDLAHRATGRTPAGFAHRARQLRDFVVVYRTRGRRWRGSRSPCNRPPRPG